jgi:hypothetical protein
MADLTAAQILTAMRERVPEVERDGRWPATIVLDAFADHVADRARHGAPAQELARYFAFVEELASSGDPGAEDLVVVDFLEAAPWGQLGVASLLGPATADLVPRAGTDPLGEDA